MTNCQSCGQFNPPQALACQHCSVHSNQQKLTGNITIPQPKNEPLLCFTLTISSTALLFDAIDTQLSFTPEPEIYMGREFAKSFPHTHLDLHPFHGWQWGISRIHARLRQDPFGQYHIMDMGSTNGTFLNSKRLSVFEPRLLRHNSLVRLGKFPILIQFTQSEQQLCDNKNIGMRGLK